VYLFMEQQASKVLSPHELHACVEFLAAHVKPFSNRRIRHDQLTKLIEGGEVLEIESNNLPFSHRTDDFPLLE
jgi:hypothetical protein